MAQPHNLTALVTVLALLLFVWLILRVGGARAKFGIDAPATTGHPEFERHFRVQMNTLESLITFLPALWLFSLYWNDRFGAALGLVWIIGRALYAFAYVKDPKSRSLGFTISAVSMLILLLGGGAGAGYQIFFHGQF